MKKHFLASVAIAVFPIGAAFAQSTVPASPSDGMQGGGPRTAPPAEASPATTAAAEAGTGGDVVVTARKRPERLLDTPTSITVFGAADLEKQRVKGVEGIANSVPSLFYQQRGSLETAITIRGVGGDPRNVGLESGVSVAIDGASVGRTNAYNTDLFQIAQVEVLRGPQGTVFGTNTIGGLINITTVKPTAEYHGNAFIEYGNYSSLRAGAYASGGLTDNLFGSLSVSGWQGGGFIHNDTRDQTLQGHNRLGGRVALRWVPTDRLEINGSFDYTRDNQKLTLQQIIAPYIGPAATYPPENRFHVNMDQPEISNLRTYGGNLSAVYDLGSAALTSITSYRNTRTLVYSDGDSLPVNLVASGPFTDQSRLVTQELRVSSTGSHRLQYVAGLFFEDQVATAFRHIALNGSYPAGADTNARIRTDAYAVFANFDYKITDKLSITAGGRYNIEVKDGSYYQYRQLYPTLSFNFPDLHRNDKQPSWTAGLKYKITSLISTYATVSTGKKSGGFNVDLLGSTASTAQNISFKPESLTSYEAGIKGEFLDRHLTLSASVFHLQYNDRQVSSYIAPPGTLPFINITNAGKSRTNGFEIEGSLRLPQDLTVSASISHLNGKYTSFPNATAAGASYTGNTTEFTPDYTATVNLDKAITLSSGQLVLHADTHYQGNTYLDATDNKQNFQPGYWLVDGRIGYEFKISKSGATTGIYFFGKNLTNKAYLVFARQASGANTGLYGDPRTYGLELRVKY